MAKNITVKQAIESLNTKYANTLVMLDDALDLIEDLETKLAEKPKEVQVEIEKIVTVEKQIPVEKETVVTIEKEVPGPERIVEVEVPGPERIVEVEKEIIKEVIVEVPVEKIVEKKIKVPVEKEVIKEVEVEKIVEKEIEKIVHVQGPERVVVRTDTGEIDKLTVQVEELEKKLKVKPKVVEKIVEVPVEKIIEVPVEVIREIEKIVEGPRRPKVIEKDASGDLLGAATLIANSELNINDLSTNEVLNMLKDLSEEEVNKQLGFWAIPLPKDGDTDEENTNPTYLKK
jgi:hypothetical protein